MIKKCVFVYNPKTSFLMSNIFYVLLCYWTHFLHIWNFYLYYVVRCIKWLPSGLSSAYNQPDQFLDDYQLDLSCNFHFIYKFLCEVFLGELFHFILLYPPNEVLEMNIQKNSQRENFYLCLEGLLTNVLKTLETKFIYRNIKLFCCHWLALNAGEATLPENTTFIL